MERSKKIIFILTASLCILFSLLMLYYHNYSKSLLAEQEDKIEKSLEVRSSLDSIIANLGSFERDSTIEQWYKVRMELETRMYDFTYSLREDIEEDIVRVMKEIISSIDQEYEQDSVTPLAKTLLLHVSLLEIQQYNLEEEIEQINKLNEEKRMVKNYLFTSVIAMMIGLFLFSFVLLSGLFRKKNS